MSNNAHEIGAQQEWHEKFPSFLSGLFSFYQCLCTIGIIGCELGSILIDLFNSTIYVGFWAGLFFMIAWILQAISVTCRFTHRFATYTLIIQCISLVFAACVIAFDTYFLIYPTTCFFSLSLCNSTAPLRGIYYSKDNFNNIKIPLIKGQLATAVILFAFYIDSIIIYVVTSIQMRKINISKGPRPTLGASNEGALNTTNDTIEILSIHPTTYVDASTSIKSPQTQSARLDRSTSTNNNTMNTTLVESLYHSRWSLGSND